VTQTTLNPQGLHGQPVDLLSNYTLR